MRSLLTIVFCFLNIGCAYLPALKLDVLDESVQRAQAVEIIAESAVQTARAVEILAGEVGSDEAKQQAVLATYTAKSNHETFSEDTRATLADRRSSIAASGAFFDTVGSLIGGDIGSVLLGLLGLGGAGAAIGSQRKAGREKERGDRLEAKGARLADLDPRAAMDEVKKDPDFRYIN